VAEMADSDTVCSYPSISCMILYSVMAARQQNGILWLHTSYKHDQLQRIVLSRSYLNAVVSFPNAVDTMVHKLYGVGLTEPASNVEAAVTAEYSVSQSCRLEHPHRLVTFLDCKTANHYLLQ